MGVSEDCLLRDTEPCLTSKIDVIINLLTDTTKFVFPSFYQSGFERSQGKVKDVELNLTLLPKRFHNQCEKIMVMMMMPCSGTTYF